MEFLFWIFIACVIGLILYLAIRDFKTKHVIPVSNESIINEVNTEIPNNKTLEKAAFLAQIVSVLVLIGLIVGGFNLFTYLPREYGILLSKFIVPILVLAFLLFIQYVSLYNFASHVKKGIRTNDPKEIGYGFSSLSNFFLIWILITLGIILTPIVMLMYF
jgi:hypothetical protein